MTCAQAACKEGHAALLQNGGAVVACGLNDEGQTFALVATDLRASCCPWVPCSPAVLLWSDDRRSPAAGRLLVSATSLRWLRSRPTRKLPLEESTQPLSRRTAPPLRGARTLRVSGKLLAPLWPSAESVRPADWMMRVSATSQRMSLFVEATQTPPGEPHSRGPRWERCWSARPARAGRGADLRTSCRQRRQGSHAPQRGHCHGLPPERWGSARPLCGGHVADLHNRYRWIFRRRLSLAA